MDEWTGQPPSDLAAYVDGDRVRQGHSPELGVYVELREPAWRGIALLLPWLAVGLLSVLEFAGARYSDCWTYRVSYCGEGVPGATRVAILVFAIACLAVAAAYLWRLLVRRPGLVLGTQGFENRTGRLRAQRVRWADVVEVRVQDRWDWWVHRAWIMEASAPGRWITIRTSGLGLPPSIVEAEIQTVAAAHRDQSARQARHAEPEASPPSSP